ncbi:hypothetical protein [Achromobacter insolitus]|uniref:hypothetical protein n=1 Tax=Achromobacter insolitus TaxID=217204 RepID=UPI0007C29535|nr:hypothetical protein [Achromobacter insolitus]OAD16452.1 hypothetical protein A3839_28280 [Achromobacter insolitus]
MNLAGPTFLMKKKRTSMNTPIWTTGGNGEDRSQHFMIIGSTGKGRSSLLQAEADRRGISYEELEHCLEPTKEQKEQMRMREEAEQQEEELRLQAVRQAIWDAWSDDESAFSRIHDALVSTVMDDSPSQAQLKAVFMMLSATIIGKGISWGFDDTEVGDDIYQFIEENKEAVVAQLASAKT